MENIFSDVFKNLFDNPFADKGEEKKPVDTKKVEDSLTKMLNTWGDNTKKRKQKAVESTDTKKIDKELKKDKIIEAKPMSKRFTDDDVKDKNKKLSLDEYDGKNTIEIDSTAIGVPVRYNKETGEVWIRFNGKNGKPTGKWYHYVNMSEDQFKSFMKSSSKGRYVNFIMKYKNHDPAYGPTPKRKK